MKSSIKIGIDFDKIFVNYPPIIPGSLIELLYKKKARDLKYRIPGTFERKIRNLSHTPILRRPIHKNIRALSDMFDENRFSFYLISSRFSFLKKRTEDWYKNYHLDKYFDKMYFNFKDEQPHVFKDKIIKKEGIKKFIDDDLDLLNYLAKQNPNVEFFWLNSGKSEKKLLTNIKRVNDLKDFEQKFT